MRRRKLLLWGCWLTTTFTMSAYFIWMWKSDERTKLLPGATTDGHYQIEMNCSACHTPWMGVKEEACYECHAEELKLANDSHPKSKFTDPRNADRLTNIDAANCVTCHREHSPGMTHPMGVTMPLDYCFHCHQQTLKERASHANLPFDSCATAGCHNYHDNRGLYTDFLLNHASEPSVKEPALAPVRIFGALLATTEGELPPTGLTAEDQDAPRSVPVDEQILRDWSMTTHSAVGVNCSQCHTRAGEEDEPGKWSDTVDYSVCARCHEAETKGFLAGRHGMRLAQGLSPMTPAMARLPMKQTAAHLKLTCVSCHPAHDFDTRRAAVESCLECHDDSHSLAYLGSSHHALWQNELDGSAPIGSGVSCATCHLPRMQNGSDDKPLVLVQHNQNDNLRPNEKMIRSVCLDCHGLGFSIDALADTALVQTNFIGQPSRHIKSIDMAVEWQMDARKTKTRK